MKSKVKQILSVIMTICMLSTMIPLTAYGADVDFDDDATVTAEASSTYPMSPVCSQIFPSACV